MENQVVDPPVISANLFGLHFRDADGRDIRIAENMSFDLFSGESLCLVGRSGSGKTSILRSMAGLLSGYSGSIAWWGADLRAMGEREIRATRGRRIGYVDQASTLIPDLTALENVLVPVLPQGRATVKRMTKRAQALLADLGLAARSDALPAMMSGGEKQRTAIARSLLLDPDLLIVDEPTASLDAGWAQDVIGLLDEHKRRGCTLLLASHDPFVSAGADRVMQVEADWVGRRMAESTSAEAGNLGRY